MRRILLLVIAVFVTGCTSNVTRSTLSGDYKTLADEGQQTPELLSLPTNELWAYCQSFVKSRVFTPIDGCLNELDKRFEDADNTLLYMVQGWFDTQFIAPGAFGEGMLTELKLEAAMARGNIKNTERLANSLYDLTTTYAYPLAVTDTDYADRYPQIAGYDESGYSNIYRLKHQVLALGTLGLMAARNNQPELASGYARKIAAIDASSTNAAQWRLPQAKALWLGRIYLTLGDFEEAYQASVIEKNAMYEFLDGLTTALDVIGPIMYAAMVDAYGDTDYKTALNFTAEFEPRFVRHQAELETGRLAAAQEGYQAIIDEPKVKGFGTVYWQALYGLGRIADLQSKKSQAIDYYQQAIAVIERQRKSMDTEAGRIGFVNDKQAVYGDLVSLLVKEQRFSDAYDYVERAKARALVDLLATKQRFGSQLPPATEQALTSLQSIERQALENDGGITNEATRGIAVQLKAIKQTTPQLASLLTVAPPSLPSIQRRLGKQETLLLYFFSQGRQPELFTFVVTASSLAVHSQPMPALKETITALRDAINQGTSTAWQQEAVQLYNHLIAPVNDKLSTARTLTIVPHGVLHYLPFNILTAYDNRLLSEQFSLRLLPAASVLQFVDEKVAGEQLLALANPNLNAPELDLPGAQREARQISALWPQSQVFSRAQASESLLKQQSANFQIIHLASHGVFNPDAPLQSRLFLAADAANDGLLTVPEIYDLNLNANLVVLSACETGLGDISAGDDVVGLNRGFLFAGANGIVSSLWQVPDEATTYLISRFYTYLQSETPSSALAAAQQDTRAVYPHPFYWAAFQLTGGQ